MKKPYLYCIVFILTVHLSASQDVRFGINGSANLCGLNGPDKPVSLDKNIGYGGGLYIDSRIGEYMSSLFELNYNRYRFHFTGNIPLVENSLLTVNEINDYISLPAMLRYKKGYEFIFAYLNAGIQMSVLLKSNRETSLHINDLMVDSDYYYKYKTNRIDYGLTGGVGIQFKAVNVDLRYYFSTKNLYDEVDSREMRYSAFHLGLSYQFNYQEVYRFGRKTGWKGFKHKIKHLFK